MLENTSKNIVKILRQSYVWSTEKWRARRKLQTIQFSSQTAKTVQWHRAKCRPLRGESCNSSSKGMGTFSVRYGLPEVYLGKHFVVRGPLYSLWLDFFGVFEEHFFHC